MRALRSRWLKTVAFSYANRGTLTKFLVGNVTPMREWLATRTELPAHYQQSLFILGKKSLEKLHREREDDGTVLISRYLGKGLQITQLQSG